ncbi:MAG: hypothetical protein ACKV2Q_09460 [Planctomycetaceae bacterium]
MVIFNTNGLLCGVVALITALAISSLTHSLPFSALCAGVAVIAFDINMRRKNSEVSAPIVHPNAGGHIWFIPAWILGTAVVVVGIAMWFGFLR